MKVSRNGIWKSADSDLLSNSVYRILDVMHDVDTIVVFDLLNTSRTVRPMAVSITAFTEQVKLGLINKAKFTLPSFLLVAEALLLKSMELNQEATI